MQGNVVSIDELSQGHWGLVSVCSSPRSQPWQGMGAEGQDCSWHWGMAPAPAHNCTDLGDRKLQDGCPIGLVTNLKEILK